MPVNLCNTRAELNVITIVLMHAYLGLNSNINAQSVYIRFNFERGQSYLIRIQRHGYCEYYAYFKLHYHAPRVYMYCAKGISERLPVLSILNTTSRLHFVF